MAEEKVAMTLEQAQEALKQAMASQNMPEVIRLAGIVKKLDKTAGSAELEAKKGQINDLGEKIKLAFQNHIVDQFGAEIVQLVGEKKAIIKLDWDYEGQVPTVKIVKGVAGTRKPGSGKGGGNPQKFEMSSDDLLAKFGTFEYKEGQTFKEAWDSTTDKNARYSIRRKLIKLQQENL